MPAVVVRDTREFSLDTYKLKRGFQKGLDLLIKTANAECRSHRLFFSSNHQCRDIHRKAFGVQHLKSCSFQLLLHFCYC